MRKLNGLRRRYVLHLPEFLIHADTPISIAGYYVLFPGESAPFVKVSKVESRGKSILCKVIRPDSSTTKAAEISYDFLIPAKAEYVLFRSRR